ncbi:helix-turn-helix domain-containing protein [Salisaeta longa]|uniref:helix-turn-helix domain-containing protein n=1 Tax=Salisaeta longa TaxID=503170 RepID=UPI0003B47A14|nr:helix-turn-helix transcriptional regulator [Salisaeta longa]
MANVDPMPGDIEELFEDLEETPEDIASDLMDLVRYQIGRRLEEYGWTQEDLAEAMGVKPPTVSRLLNSENPTLLSIAKMAKALDLAVPVLKFVPKEEMEDQTDEVKSFVCSEKNGAGWWPVTRRRSSHVRNRMREFIQTEVRSAGRVQPPSIEAAEHIPFDTYATLQEQETI